MSRVKNHNRRYFVRDAEKKVATRAKKQMALENERYHKAKEKKPEERTLTENDLVIFKERVKSQKAQHILNLIRSFFRLIGIMLVDLIIIFFVIAIAYTGFGLFHSRRIIKDNVLVRNIELAILPEEPDDKVLPWSSELPDFVERDIEYMRKKENIKRIEYKYGLNTIEINDSLYSEDKIVVEDYSGDNRYYHLEDFSIYLSKDGNYVTVYGYYYETFVKKSYFRNSKVKEERISADKNIPLNKPDCYSMTINDDEAAVYIGWEDHKICLYKDGKIISNVIEADIVDYVWNDTFLDSSGKLYKIYVLKGEEYTIKLVEIGQGYKPDYSIDLKYDDDEYYYFLVFKKDGESYLFTPDNWDYSDGNITYPEDTNFSWKPLNVKDCITSARIEYFSDGWKTLLTYDFNGKKAKSRHLINGYDHNITISEEDRKELEKEIHSEEEYWDAVTKIRETYAKYYDYPE